MWPFIKKPAFAGSSAQANECRAHESDARPLESEGVIHDGARIHQLIQHLLHFVAATDGGWSRLYRDTADGRYWELTYPRSELHGGGPPLLTVLSAEDVRARYDVA